MKEINKIKSDIVKILKKHKISKAGIFGSYARGEQKKNSDVDILIEINDKNLSLLGFIKIKHQLEDSIGNKIDLVEYKALKPIIAKNALKEEVRII
jgi:hypothetical protein